MYMPNKRIPFPIMVKERKKSYIFCEWEVTILRPSVWKQHGSYFILLKFLLFYVVVPF